MHIATNQFTAPVNRVLTAAPHIAVFNDTFQNIAFSYMNAAGILDESGVAWANTSVDLLNEGGVGGVADGGLFDPPASPTTARL